MTIETLQTKIDEMIQDVQRARNKSQAEQDYISAGQLNTLYIELKECLVISIRSIQATRYVLSDLIYKMCMSPLKSPALKSYLQDIENLLQEARKDNENESKNTEVQ